MKSKFVASLALPIILLLSLAGCTRTSSVPGAAQMPSAPASRMPSGSREPYTKSKVDQNGTALAPRPLDLAPQTSYRGAGG